MIGDKYEKYVIDIRRDLHRNPEIGGNEKRTSKIIIEEIKSMNVAYEVVGEYGILATLKGNNDGKTVMLRADIDALPVQEDKCNLVQEKTVVSEIDGVSHVCGHDAHTAMLLGAMKTLVEMKDQINGTILFCFEQGEENGTGINPMLHVLKNKKIDAAWGLHFHPHFPSGSVCVDPGPRMAAACVFDILIHGKGGHGARPDLAIDPIQCLANVLIGINAITTRELDPNEAVVLHIGRVHAGETGNVFPETAEIKGGFRCFKKELISAFKEALSRIVTHTAEAHRCKSEVLFNLILNPVTNDPILSNIASGSVKKALGEDKLVDGKPLNGSETFGMYLDLCPGVYGFIGLDNEALGSGEYNHNPKFDIDESAMKNGVAVTVQFALDFLNQ
ncbi:M20 metallopeptidase family protein [Fusibacter ferrireducens]|uniref:Amidohydrolase n=1 Tax=Fusibacter ferrireducens TaxID=2785058 RepID=A0ABR9ZP05_9FIRM|nr:amidohydrolase [Fusibacter ferrireducens]MBF4692198.1 amidohydrolase [Fusibacter ferrireducens]